METRIREQARRDPGFRARLRADPAGAVAEALGVDLSEGVRVRVVEESPDEVVLILPSDLSDSADLDPHDLEALAGGAGGQPTDGAPPTADARPEA